MNYYVDSTEQSGRIRTAYLLGRARYGWRSLTEFQLETIMERVEALEAELNNGEPFAPSNAGPVPAGRPLERHRLQLRRSTARRDRVLLA